MRKIYIVLTHTGTIVSRLIKIFTRNKYSHVSIALDENMDEMYSFGRLNPYNPFLGGFVREGIHIGTFKRFKNTKSQIFSLEIADEQYQKLKDILEKMCINKQAYKFNITGLVFALFRKRLMRKNKFYCSQFVRYVMENSDIKDKHMSEVIKPEDFKKLENLHMEYEGLLRLYDASKLVKLKENIKALKREKVQA